MPARRRGQSCLCAFDFVWVWHQRQDPIPKSTGKIADVRRADRRPRIAKHESQVTNHESRSQSRRVQVLCGVGGCNNVCITTQYCSVFSRNAAICSAVAPGAAISKFIRIFSRSEEHTSELQS